MVDLSDWQEQRLMEIIELLRDIRDRLPDPEKESSGHPDLFQSSGAE
jgi:hypothetical protein